MTITASIVLFVVIWFLTLFVVLQELIFVHGAT